MKGLESLVDRIRSLLIGSEAPTEDEYGDASSRRPPRVGDPEREGPHRARSRRYRAFIAHAHGEEPRLARALARELERFRPASRRPQIYVDPNVSSESEIPWESIVFPLGASEHLIFLASPAAAGSERCQKIVEYWLARRPPSTMTLVLARGEMHWEKKRSAFDQKATTALPPALLTTLRNEPISFDLRKGLRDPVRASGADRSEVIWQLAPRVFGLHREDLWSRYVDSQWYAETEFHELLGEMCLQSRDYAGAIRAWVEAYRRSLADDLLLKIVRTYHRDCLSRVSTSPVPFAPIVAGYVDGAGLMVGGLSQGAQPTSLACMGLHGDVKQWSTAFAGTLITGCVGTHADRLFFFSCVDDALPGAPVPVAIPPRRRADSSSSDRIVCFDVGTRRLLHLAEVWRPTGLAMDRGGQLLAFWEHENVHLCALDAGPQGPALALRRSFEDVVPNGRINEVAFVESLGALAFCTGDDLPQRIERGAVGLLNLATGKKVWTQRVHDAQVNTISLRFDNTAVVSASNDGTLALWDIATGNLMQRWRVDDQPVHVARFTPSGKRIVSVTAAGTQVWDGQTGTLLRLMPGQCGILVMDPARDRFWLLGAAAVLVDLDVTHQLVNLNRDVKLISEVAYDADGRHAVAVCRSTGWHGLLILHVYDTHTGECIATCVPGPHHVSLYRAELSATGRYLVVDAGITSQSEDESHWRIMDAETILFDARTGETVARFDTDRKLSLDPKERCYVAVVDDELVFETIDGERTLMVWPRPAGRVSAIAWHSGGDLLAVKFSPKERTDLCRFLRIDWETHQIVDHWPATKLASWEGRFEFDLLEEHLYVDDSGGRVLAIEAGRTQAIEVSANPLRSVRTANYLSKRSVKLLPDEQRPHPDPYLYALDGQAVGAMQRDLLDPSLDVGGATERLLDEILWSL